MAEVQNPNYLVDRTKTSLSNFISWTKIFGRIAQFLVRVDVYIFNWIIWRKKYQISSLESCRRYSGIYIHKHQLCEVKASSPKGGHYLSGVQIVHPLGLTMEMCYKRYSIRWSIMVWLEAENRQFDSHFTFNWQKEKEIMWLNYSKEEFEAQPICAWSHQMSSSQKSGAHQYYFRTKYIIKKTSCSAKHKILSYNHQ